MMKNSFLMCTVLGGLSALLNVGLVNADDAPSVPPMTEICAVKVKSLSCALKEVKPSVPANVYCSQGQPCTENKCPGHQTQTIFATQSDWAKELDQYELVFDGAAGKKVNYWKEDPESIVCYSVAICVCEPNEAGTGVCYVDLSMNPERTKIQHYNPTSAPCVGNPRPRNPGPVVGGE